MFRSRRLLCGVKCPMDETNESLKLFINQYQENELFQIGSVFKSGANWMRVHLLIGAYFHLLPQLLCAGCCEENPHIRESGGGSDPSTP